MIGRILALVIVAILFTGWTHGGGQVPGSSIVDDLGNFVVDDLGNQVVAS